MGGRLTAAPQVRDVVAALQTEVVQPMGGRAPVLCTLERDQLRIVGSSGVSRGSLRRLDGLVLQKGTPEADAILTVRPLLFSSGQELRAGCPDLDRYQDAGPIAFLPMVSDCCVTGCCVIVHDRAQIFEDEEEFALLMIMLGQVSQSLERARAYETQREMAQGMQRVMLPRGLPNLREVETTARYFPATAEGEVGGDWYDVIKIRDGEVAMIVGDVEGHNLDAVGIMGQLRSGVRAYAAEGHDPASVLTRSNRLLCELDTDLFTTCCCMWLDLETGLAMVASAGHPPPFVTNVRGEAESAQLTVGPPLGVDPDAVYQATPV